MTLTAADTALHPFLTDEPKQLLIGGRWQPSVSGETFPSVNPSTGRTIAHLASGGAADVDLAVTSARRAFEGPWRSFTPVQRQNVLLKLAQLIEDNFESLRRLDAIDMGSPVGASPRTNIEKPVELCRYYAGWPTKIYGETIPTSSPGPYFTYTVREPVGVVGAIIPWNGPFQSSLMKIAPVLATGCTVVLKPSEEACLSVLLLGELIQQLDLPPGVVNIVTGFGPTAGAALSSHPDVDKIAFTGSTATGQSIVRASAGNLKRVSMELGGKSPDIIFADADLDRAVPTASMGVFGAAGQMCVACARVYVERPVYDEFVERMATFSRGLVVGNSLDPATTIGPIISAKQLAKVTGFIDGAQAEGARTQSGGARLTDPDRAAGFFVEPTVLSDVTDTMRVAREEVFGPVAAVMPFDDVDDVVRRANSTNYGLAGAVWTRDLGTAHQMAARINTGTLWVNSFGMFEPGVPFGGSKMSGWGSEHGVQSLDEYFNVKTVWMNTTPGRQP
jgi:aldehyde dehydrogenase (NAD+)